MGSATAASPTALGSPPRPCGAGCAESRANCDAVRVDATVATYRLDPMAGPFEPTGSALGDMVDAVGRAVSAWVLRLGPVPAPWQLAVALTGAAILAPVPRPAWRDSG
jgi:hypothetical protein